MRYAFVMYLRKGCEDVYKQRHDTLPEPLAAVLKQHGICDYSIYLHRQSGYLFAVMDVPENFDDKSLACSPIMQKWWRQMAPLMQTDPHSNRPKTTPLQRVFYLP